MPTTYEIITHALLTLALLLIVSIFIVYAARHIFGNEPKLKSLFVQTSFAIVFIKVIYVIYFYLLLYPQWGLRDDPRQYYFDIYRILRLDLDPALFSQKNIGMAYFYATIMYTFDVFSIYGYLAINVFIGYFACYTVFLITRELTDQIFPAFFAFFLACIHPEMIFWNGRLMKENLILVFVPLLTLSAIKLSKKFSLSYLLLLIVSTWVIFVTRIYLIMFLGLISSFYVLVYLKKNIVASFAIIIAGGALATIFWNKIFMILRMVFYKKLNKSTNQIDWNLVFDTLLININKIFAIKASGKFGLMGLILTPFILVIFYFLIATILNYKKIFQKNYLIAAMLIYISLSYYLFLAVTGFTNLRFRTAVAPFIVSLISVSCYYYWQKFNLPRLRLFPKMKRTIE